jgi:AcrR family transcriptional regulator
MSPRRYRVDPVRRRASIEKTRRRIVEATVHLHAKHGVTGTTYAMIAKRADVSLPTVYNHFPTPDDLYAACSGHVLGQVPPLGPHIFEGAPDVRSRLRALARAMCGFYRFVQPWLRWTYYEARLVPEIAERYKKAAEQRRALIVLAVEPAFGSHPPEAFIAVCAVLLEFPAWESLTNQGRLSTDAAEAALTDALVELAEAQASRMTLSSPRRKL